MRTAGWVLFLAMLGPAAASAKDTGVICIAPFDVKLTPEGFPVPEPNMSKTTWGPSKDSKFTFRVDKKLKATVGKGEMVLIKDVPADRKVLVEIRLDGKPYESFRLDLRKEPDRRVCLWLYENYWHWVNLGWDPKLGCKCKVE
ncbi:MAG TPA: hypothetical protein VF789_34555 [Thermoanaerobaculia bacterium]